MMDKSISALFDDLLVLQQSIPLDLLIVNVEYGYECRHYAGDET